MYVMFCLSSERVWTLLKEHISICSNPYVNIKAVQKVYNHDHSPEVDDVEWLISAATKHLELIKKKNMVVGCFISEKAERRNGETENNRPIDLFHWKNPVYESFTYNLTQRKLNPIICPQESDNSLYNILTSFSQI